MRYPFKTAVLPLVSFTVIVFIFQMILGDKFTSAFMLVSSDIFTRPWILLTSVFLHSGLSHLFFNMYGLLIFGPFLEQRIGAKRFLIIYLLSGITAAFLSSFFYSRALGASGAIMGMLGVLIILMPELRLLVFFVLPMPLWAAGIMWALMDSFGVFYPSGVGNIAHLVGMGCGLLYGLYLKREKVAYNKKFFQKRHLGSGDIEEYFKTGRI